MHRNRHRKEVDPDKERLIKLTAVTQQWQLLGLRDDDDIARTIASRLGGNIRINEIDKLMKLYRDICSTAQMVAEGLNGKSIADKLHTSGPHVTTLRKYAAKLNVLQTRVSNELIPRPHGIQRAVSDALTKRLGVRTTVFDTPRQEMEKDESDARYWKRRMETIANCAAPLIVSRLLASTHVGISWGTTLWHLIEAISREETWRGRTEPLTVIPMAGEMVGSDAVESRSCSALADKLASAIRRNDRTVLSLRGIPSFISTRTPNGDAKAVMTYFQKLSTFRTVAEFSGTLDTIVTSIGTHAQPNKLYVAELRESGVDTEELQALCCGDIGGALLEASGLTKTQRSQFLKISRRWLGMSKNVYHACATRAAQSDRPGVIVIAIASNKARILKTCIEQGLVSECFIDADLAGSL